LVRFWASFEEKEFTNGLEMECERKKKVKDDFRIFDLAQLKE
jgi:hypothetical protein